MCISLDLNGSKIHAIYLVEFLKKIKWHDGMMTWCNAKIKEQAQKKHTVITKIRKSSEVSVSGRYNTAHG